MERNYLTYNRDLNTSGSITSYNAVPEYGTSVDFEFLDFSFYTQDNHTKYSEKELNNFLINFNLKFTQQTEDQAKSIVSFLEKVSTGISGAETTFNFLENNSDGVSIEFPTGKIYKKINGLLIDNYDVKFHNGLFDIDLNVKTNLDSPLLNWKDSTFLNSKNVKTYNFADPTEYEKFDVIYQGHTGFIVEGTALLNNALESGAADGLYKTKTIDQEGNKVYEHVDGSKGLNFYNHPSSGKWVLGSNQVIDGNEVIVSNATKIHFVENDTTKKRDIADVVNWKTINETIQGSENNLQITEKSHLYFDKQEDKTKRYFYLSESGLVPTRQYPIPIPLDRPRFQEFIDQITGESIDSFIHSDFIFEPDDDVSISFKNSTNILKFNSSIQEAQNLSKNKNIIESLNLKFSNRSDKETFCLLHYLEKNGPPKFFKAKLPKLFVKDKFFKVNKFSHNFIYKDCNTVSLQLQEVVEPQKVNFPEGFYLSCEKGNTTNGEVGADYGNIFGNLATEDFKKISLEYIDNVNDKEDLRPISLFNPSQDDVQPAALVFKLEWENQSSQGFPVTADEGYDLDIYVKAPNDVEYYWENVSDSTRNPGLIKDNRGEDLSNSGDVGGPEHLFWKDNDQTLRGEYQYRVELFNLNSVARQATYQVQVIVSGEVQATNVGVFTDDQLLDTSSPTFTFILDNPSAI
tara:strand:- start:342 stop:2402 length:2061 start_codon:yes stop_codon:yes gene_type:complete